MALKIITFDDYGVSVIFLSESNIEQHTERFVIVF